MHVAAVEIRHLRALLAVADAGGSGSVADRRLVAELEAVIGTELITEGSSSWTLSEHGGALAARSRAIVDAFDRAVAVAGADGAIVAGRCCGSVASPTSRSSGCRRSWARCTCARRG